MIVSMSRVEIIGPKGVVNGVLETLRNTGVIHLDTKLPSCLPEDPQTPPLQAITDNPQQLTERVFLQDLLSQTEQILERMPETAVRDSFLRPESALEAIKTLSPRHLKQLDDLGNRRTALRRERDKLSRYNRFLAGVAPLLDAFPDLPELELIGVELERPGDLDRLRELLEKKLADQFELQVATLADQTTVAVIALPQAQYATLGKELRAGNLPEYSAGAEERDLPVQKRQSMARERLDKLELEQQTLEEQHKLFARRWKPIYLAVHAWLKDRIALSNAASVVGCTRMCFVIQGWVPSAEVGTLRSSLRKLHGPEVVLNETDMHDEDLDRIPVALKNPPVVRPYELFTRMLPLPRYRSVDPTPYIAIFFPIFFGMILGDLGYAVVLAVGAAVGLAIARRTKPLVRDLSIILLTSSFYTGLFGVLYGEVFGEWGAHHLRLEPLLLDRGAALIPMFLFALAVGTVHVLIGLLLGIGTAIRRHQPKEAVTKFLGILVVTAAALLLLSFATPSFESVRRPLSLAVLVAIPLLIVFGGLLAPLEMLKYLGHIVSYARIMAVGLTSVMLAFVANELGGSVGSMAAGITIAALLHLFNLVLGVFAPTVHALRLHFVEFFSKFFEGGGPRYTPLKKG